MEAKYLFEDRDFIIPCPKKTPKWERVTSENVTEQTMKALDKLGEFFPHVSFFSWHPNIKDAKYSDSRNQHFDSNYNSRIRIGDSIIVKSWPGSKTIPAVMDGWKTIKSALDHIPELETLGGSGSSDENSKSYQMQISFLKTVGTHEESNTLKNSIITHGAFSIYKGEWFYIPAHEFDPFIPVKKKLEKRGQEIINIFKNHPSIIEFSDKIAIHSRKENNDKIYTCNFNFCTPQESLILLVYEDHYKVWNNLFTTSRSDTENTHFDLKSLLERIGGLKKETIEDLSEDPSNFKEILHPYCGRVAARKFGF